MNTQIKVTDEAVDKALDVAMDDGHNGLDCRPERDFGDTTRAALEAAAPHLQVQVDREALEECVTDALIAADDLTAAGYSARIEADADDIARVVAAAVAAFLSPEETK